MSVLKSYKDHVRDREADGLPPLPLSAEQTIAVCGALKSGENPEGIDLIDLLTNRVSPGVDPAALVKSDFLAEVAEGEVTVSDLSPRQAIELLGTMVGGYNLRELVELLGNDSIVSGPNAETLFTALANTIIVDDSSFEKVNELRQGGNEIARRVIQSWADAEWFSSRPEMPEEIRVKVLKIDGESNTDDLSPAQAAPSRPDIPLHAKSMLMNRASGALATIAELQEDGSTVALCGDVLWTGSSRKSAWNSVAWVMGNKLPFIPNKGGGAIVIGGGIAPIGRDTIRDGGGLAIVCDVSKIEDGATVLVCPHNGQIKSSDGSSELAEFDLPAHWFDEWRAGGRLHLVTGKKLTAKAREALGLGSSTAFSEAPAPADTGKGFTLSEKTVGRACGLPGVRPGQSCEPEMATVLSQDTTGPMTRDEIIEQASLQFAAGLVLQSFCHTAATPNATDLKMHKTLPVFIQERGGVSLRPGDGVIHTWGNRMLVPDQVGTGGDSHTRFPMGISFPAGSGLVAFAASTGTMPLDMPETVLVRFTGELQPGITIRDLVHAIPYVCLRDGRLTLEKKGKVNIFNGRVMEIDVRNIRIKGRGLTIEQAFEFADASAERSSAACCMINDPDEVVKYLRGNVTLLSNLLTQDYGNADTIRRRIAEIEAWLENPELLLPDDDCEYVEEVVINMSEITEPLLCCPNDPDDVKLLSEVAGDEVDETFMGSCMTHLGHFQDFGKILALHGAAESQVWVAPPTYMDISVLTSNGTYDAFRNANAHLEPSGCSLCMGNQKRVADGATVVSTSTRNFPNRMGSGAFVYLASAEVTALTSVRGEIPTVADYMDTIRRINHEPVHHPHQFDETGVPERVASC